MSNYAIYKPTGKAAEYSEWACNFYVGCSNDCSYCYCKKGVLSSIMGGNIPTLKKCFKNKEHALEVFKKELSQNIIELQEHGLFFSFTTDPMLPEIIDLTEDAIGHAQFCNVPCKILTKCTQWVEWYIADEKEHKDHSKDLIAYGFTLTGHDELEPYADTNQQRIEAMKRLHDAGFKTFASIEPIIDFESSLQMITATQGFCDIYKIGLKSGDKFSKSILRIFISEVLQLDGKIYFKDSLLKQADIDREDLPNYCVECDYNIFKP